MQLGIKFGNGEKLTWEEAFERAQDPLRDWQYTPDMLALMRIDYDDPDREPGVESFTPTRLMGCHRQAVLMEETDYFIDADQSWPLVRGHMVHALMESARYPGATTTIRETRLRTEVQTKYGPQPFTAKPDLIVVNRIETDWPSDEGHGQGNAQETIHVKVVDYKSKNGIKHDLTTVSNEHGLQVNMYAWIIRRELPAQLGMPEAEIVVDELEIDYIDMARVRRFTSAGWRTDRGKRLTRTRPYEYETLHLAPIHIWTDEKVGRFIRRRIEERLDAKQPGGLPPCEYVGTEKEYLCQYCPMPELCYADIIPNRPAQPERPAQVIQVTARKPTRKGQ